MIKHIWAVYFSPSGKTEQVTMAVAEGAAGVMNIDTVSYTHLHSEYAEGNVLTEYEERFTAKGNPICRLVAHRDPQKNG